MVGFLDLRLYFLAGAGACKARGRLVALEGALRRGGEGGFTLSRPMDASTARLRCISSSLCQACGKGVR